MEIYIKFAGKRKMTETRHKFSEAECPMSDSIQFCLFGQLDEGASYRILLIPVPIRQFRFEVTE